MKKIYLIVLCLFSLVCSANYTLDATVTYIQDGDTIKVRSLYGHSYVVRMWGIDAPESYFQGQDQGKHAFAAKNYLKAILPLKSQVTIITSDEFDDGNNRVLGRVLLDGDDINYHLLEMGLVIPYLIYPYEPKLASSYIEASKTAALGYIGIFDYQNPLQEMPYQFRMRVRNWTPRNYIGDFYTKKYYLPEDYEMVPAWRTVFFESHWDAQEAGYSE